MEVIDPATGPVASAKPSIWPQVAISIVVMAIWAGSLALQQFGRPMLDPDNAGLLRGAVWLTIGYWLGSSIGSARKDNRPPEPAVPAVPVVVGVKSPPVTQG